MEDDEFSAPLQAVMKTSADSAAHPPVLVSTRGFIIPVYHSGFANSQAALVSLSRNPR
jgi:hypothetical protein